MQSPRMQQAGNSSPCGGNTMPRPRKIRKGTQSCWECKRSKTRCTYQAASTVCNSCRRRGKNCVSQQLPDKGPSTITTEERLARVEGVVEQLAKRADIDVEHGNTSHLTKDSTTFTEPRSIISHGLGNSATLAGASSKWEVLHNQLVEAWPDSRELDLIWVIPADIQFLLHRAICTSANVDSEKPTSVQSVLQLPPVETHPIQTARKFLMMGLFLQSAPSCPSLDADRRKVIMSRVVETANDLALCHDELVGSAEGIECLFMRSIYHNNAGNLRHAWLAIRRAILMAQSIGLQSGAIVTLREGTKIIGGPRNMWFRLVHMDRYLSLLLGSPMGSYESTFADQQVLEWCTPLERMQRIQCMVTGSIIQQTQTSSQSDLEATFTLDEKLHESTSRMPPNWWLPPSTSVNEENSLGNNVQVMDLFAHHHLLTRLHLPYLLRDSPDGRYDYSKMTTIMASREILSRVVSFQNMNWTMPYCRGIDFLAFVASTTLCLAHIDGRRQCPLSNSKTYMYNAVYRCLINHRPADRSLVEKTLEIMDFKSNNSHDPIASRIIAILQPLLEIENSAEAGEISVDPQEQHGEVEHGCEGGLAEDGNVLRISIPHFGTIRVDRRGIFRSSRDFSAASGSSVLVNHQAPDVSNDQAWQDGSSLGKSQDTFVLDEDWTLQGVDYALFSDLFSGTGDLATIDESSVNNFP